MPPRSVIPALHGPEPERAKFRHGTPRPVVALAVLARRQLGGYTGDVLGAFQQIGEIVMLLTAAAAA